jgi:hypothetical protein
MRSLERQLLPKIRLANLPRPLWQHILDRVADRAISLDDLQQLRRWVNTEPYAPAGDWYKDLGVIHPVRHRRVPEDGVEEGNETVWNSVMKERLI